MDNLGKCVVCGKQLEVKRYYDKSGKFKGYGQSFNKVTCSRACTNVYRAGVDLEARFWQSVDRSGGPNACWPFLKKTRNKQGYGRMQWGDKLESAHRIAWSLANGEPIPNDDDVLHICDNPPCCNPDHLFLGDHDDNMADMVAKGRSSRKVGERNGRALVSEEMAREIKRRYQTEKISQAALGAEHGITQSAVSAIVRGVNWSHLD